jgi:GxxExxY protein
MRAFARERGSMIHEAHEERQAHEEDWGTLAGEGMTNRVIGLAIKVHRTLGPGLLEQVYEDCLGFELAHAGIRFERQVEVPLVYEGVRFDRAYRADIVVEKSVILEIKSIENILPVHESQILTYLRLSGCRIGLLMNFNTKLLKNGLRRFIL